MWNRHRLHPASPSALLPSSSFCHQTLSCTSTTVASPQRAQEQGWEAQPLPGVPWGQDRPPKGRTPPIKAVLYIWYIQSKDASLSCLVEALESGTSHSPNRMALVYHSRGQKWCGLSQNEVCEPGSCWDLTGIGCQIHSFSDFQELPLPNDFFLNRSYKEIQQNNSVQAV